MNESVKDLLHMGQRLLNLGSPREAMVIYDKILKIEPKQTDALIKKGNILGRIGRYSEAITLYDKVIIEDRENSLALINKGLAHHYLKQYDEAIKCYNKILIRKPNSTITKYNKASSLIKSNKIKEGLKILAEVIRSDFSYKAKANGDIDFQQVRKMNEFKKIILSD